jgi:hypothetical protein
LLIHPFEAIDQALVERTTKIHVEHLLELPADRLGDDQADRSAFPGRLK